MIRSLRYSWYSLRIRLMKYFSGRLFLIQLIAGVGAFALRTLLAYLFRDNMISSIIAGIIGSYTGYIGTYSLGYWLKFRKEYKVSGRSIRKDILGLQSAEQLPNLTTLIIAIAWQGLFIHATGVPIWIGVNLASWFSPLKLLNVLAALFSNSLKRGWIDGSWRAPLWIRKVGRKIRSVGRSDGYSEEVSDNSQRRSDEEQRSKVDK